MSGAIDMALKDEQQRQQKRIKTPHSSETSEDPQSVPTLMHEIIVEILLRLPVESLLRIRSVCKLWYSVISDSHFVKSHLSLSSSNNLYAHHQLIFTTRSTGRKSYLKSCRFYDALRDGSVNALEIDYPLKHPLKSVSIAGSCNGLLLIKNVDKILVIWNPSTRKSKRLPDFGSKGPGWCEVYGFGYDECTDDYKVVGISSGPYEIIVKIYSLKTGSWKRIGDNGYPWVTSVTYLNGALHWISNIKSGSSDSLPIVSLDLANETYGEIMQPVYDEGYTNMTLGAFGEWPSVLCDYGNNYADIWVMKVYGVKGSWTKLVSIPYVTHPGFDQFSVPLSISNDGKLLLQCGLKLVVYDSKNCSSSVIQNINVWTEAYIFVESLVSPDCPAGTIDNNEGSNQGKLADLAHRVNSLFFQEMVNLLDVKVYQNLSTFMDAVEENFQAKYKCKTPIIKY